MDNQFFNEFIKRIDPNIAGHLNKTFSANMKSGMASPFGMAEAAAGAKTFSPYQYHAKEHHQQGFCPTCCHPKNKCCCGHKECKKTSKELLAKPESADPFNDDKKATGIALVDDIIGGGCCVHLSIEYMPVEIVPNIPSMILVIVLDSENTGLAWSKTKIEPGYYIKEGIITTNPGAKLSLMVVNAIARVRWCEVFSC